RVAAPTHARTTASVQRRTTTATAAARAPADPRARTAPGTPHGSLARRGSNADLSDECDVGTHGELPAAVGGSRARTGTVVNVARPLDAERGRAVVAVVAGVDAADPRAADAHLAQASGR